SLSAFHLGSNAMLKKPQHLYTQSTPNMAADMQGKQPLQPPPPMPENKSLLGSIMPRTHNTPKLGMQPPGAPPPNGPLPQLPSGRKLTKRPSNIEISASAGNVPPPPLTPGRPGLPPTPSAQKQRFNLNA